MTCYNYKNDHDQDDGNIAITPREMELARLAEILLIDFKQRTSSMMISIFPKKFLKWNRIPHE